MSTESVIWVFIAILPDLIPIRSVANDLIEIEGEEDTLRDVLIGTVRKGRNGVLREISFRNNHFAVRLGDGTEVLHQPNQRSELELIIVILQLL